MKKVKEIILFMIIAYISCFIVKMIFHHFVFDVQYLLDSVFTTIGVSIGWFGYEYVHNKKEEKKDNNEKIN